MNYAINAHLRRHDTYHSWFEYTDADTHRSAYHRRSRRYRVRPDPAKDMTAAELRDHISTPHPLQWDCFLFGVVQSNDHFTFYASIAHLCVDPMIMRRVVHGDSHDVHRVGGGDAPVELPEAGRYADYCVRQREETAALTVDSPSVRGWIEFAGDNGGTLPYFPLPLGDLSVPYTGRASHRNDYGRAADGAIRGRSALPRVPVSAAAYSVAPLSRNTS